MNQSVGDRLLKSEGVMFSAHRFCSVVRFVDRQRQAMTTYRVVWPRDVLPSRMRGGVARVLGSIWFMLLAVVVARTFMAKVSALSSITDISASLISNLCLIAFYAILGLLILIRPQPKAQAASMLPRVAAFVGTYLPWCLTFTTHTDSAGLELLSSALVLTGMAMMLVTIRHLGRSFSLVPQARIVVQTGPYRWIRHPLYLAEELAVAGVVIQFFSPISLAILAAHIIIQVSRIFYEEDLLRQTLPEYSTYEASRCRLIPHIW